MGRMERETIMIVVVCVFMFTPIGEALVKVLFYGILLGLFAFAIYAIGERRREEREEIRIPTTLGGIKNKIQKFARKLDDDESERKAFQGYSPLFQNAFWREQDDETERKAFRGWLDSPLFRDAR